jgi:protein involved in polysaccharide export with SLBB domain
MALMTFQRLDGRLLAAILLLAALPAGSAAAQSMATRALANRQDLQDALAAGVSAQGTLTARERETIETRLAQGDFSDGDRILLTVRGDSALTDTFTVRQGQLNLPDLPPLSLHGVLRAELSDTLGAYVSRFLRNPQVEAAALVRVGVIGSVIRPGYYDVRADVPVSEILMAAGGLGPDADFNKTIIRRDGNERWSREEVRRAMAAGQSVDQMGMRGGDAMFVGRRGGGLAGGAIPILGALAGVTLAVFAIARGRP